MSNACPARAGGGDACDKALQVVVLDAAQAGKQRRQRVEPERIGEPLRALHAAARMHQHRQRRPRREQRLLASEPRRRIPRVPRPPQRRDPDNSAPPIHSAATADMMARVGAPDALQHHAAVTTIANCCGCSVMGCAVTSTR
jgi:hypothetical protein